MEVKIKKIKKLFDPIVKTNKRYCFSEGGTRSGKTFSHLQGLYYIASNEQNRIISVVSETMPHLKKGAMRDFFIILKQNGLYSEDNHNRTENIYKIGSTIIEFFSADSSEKIHGPERDYLFFNELQNANYETFFHLAQRTRIRVFADWNPTHEYFIYPEYINNPDYREDITLIHSTIFDNPYVAPAIKEDVLKRAKRDPRYRRVYLEGKIGTLDGLVFENWEQINELPTDLKYTYGIDFGFAAPSVMVKVAMTDNAIYVGQIFYKPEMNEKDYQNELQAIGKSEQIYADSEDKRMVNYLSNTLGYNVRAAKKPKGSVEFGVSYLQGKKIYITKDSLDVINEIRNYTYARDKNGKAIKGKYSGEDHAIDAIRYAIESKIIGSNEGVPSINF